MIENIKEYIENLKTKMPIVKAEKSGCILARIGQEGEQIKTFVSNGTLETVNRVKKNDKGKLDIVVTMASLNGEPVIDNNGHTNTYIIPRETFDKKYKNSENVGINEKFFKPTWGVQDFIQINEDIEIMASWGEIQKLKKGSYLNITNEKDIYGIALEEFNQTYSFADDKIFKKTKDETLDR